MYPTSKTILYTQRKKASGKFPVKVRVIYLGRYHDYKTNLDLTENEFTEAQIINTRKQYRNIKAQLDAIHDKVRHVFGNITGPFTFNKFKDAFYGKVKDAADIMPFFEEYIANLRSEGQLKTATNYTTTMNSLLRYRAFIGEKSTIGFHDIDIRFLKAYHTWLATPKSKDSEIKQVANPRKKTKHHQIMKGASDTTISIYIRNLRTIYNYAIDKGTIKQSPDYPFGKRKYIIPAPKNVKKALSLDQVASIYNYKALPGSAEEKARDFWMFSYMCNGINFKDIALLRVKNLDGQMLRFQRAKTKKTTQGQSSLISCHLSEKSLKIIRTWGKVSQDGNSYLFNILNEDDTLEMQQKKIDQFIKTTNKYLKRIGQEIGIDRVITTYFSRHSAATIMKKSGVSIELISESLGHSSVKTTKSYLDSFDDTSKIDIANKLSSF